MGPVFRLGPLVGLIDFGDVPPVPEPEPVPGPVEVTVGDVEDYRRIPVIVPPIQVGQRPLLRVHVAYPKQADVNAAGEAADTPEWYMSGAHPFASIDAPGPEGGTVVPSLDGDIFYPRIAQVILEDAPEDDPEPAAA